MLEATFKTFAITTSIITIPHILQKIRKKKEEKKKLGLI